MITVIIIYHSSQPIYYYYYFISVFIKYFTQTQEILKQCGCNKTMQYNAQLQQIRLDLGLRVSELSKSHYWTVTDISWWLSPVSPGGALPDETSVLTCPAITAGRINRHLEYQLPPQSQVTRGLTQQQTDKKGTVGVTWIAPNYPTLRIVMYFSSLSCWLQIIFRFPAHHRVTPPKVSGLSQKTDSSPKKGKVMQSATLSSMNFQFYHF